MLDWMAGPRRLRIRAVEVDGQALRLGVRLGTPDAPPLLICNGIRREPGADGAVRDRSGGIETVVFDVPRCGRLAGNLRYRFGGLARLAIRLMTQLGYEAQVRVLGVSWGGALAQQFAFNIAALPPPPASFLPPHQEDAASQDTCPQSMAEAERIRSRSMNF